MKTAESYAEIILNDEREHILVETPTFYTDDKIERIYEFADGAVVKYEWQNVRHVRSGDDQIFNHRFKLVVLPSPNPHNFKKGVIKVINYPDAQ